MARRYDPRYDVNQGYAAGDAMIQLAQLLRQGVGDYQRQQTIDEESGRRDQDYLLRLQQMLGQDEDRAEGKKGREFDQNMALANFLRLSKPQAPEPFTLGEGQTRFGPDGQALANVPKSPPLPKEPEPFTLGEGQTRFDPKGAPLANVPKPAAEVKPPKPFFEGKSATELRIIARDPSSSPEDKQRAKDALAEAEAHEIRVAGVRANSSLENQRILVNERDEKERGQKADQASGELGTVRELIGKMEELVPKVTYSGKLGALGGLVNKGQTYTQSNPDVNRLASLGEGYLSLIAKIVQRQSGVLSDQDLERAKKSIPLVTDRTEVAENKLADLKDILGTAERNIVQLRGGKGATPAMPQIDMNAIDAELARRGRK